MVGESEEIRLMNPIDAAEVADANRDLIVGIKVRVGRHSSGTSGIVRCRSRSKSPSKSVCRDGAYRPSAAELRGSGFAAASRATSLTHAFRPFPNSPATAQGTVKKVVLEARERGVFFDIGHGKGSFAFKTARAMLANGFYPDTISSDVHILCITGQLLIR